MLKKSNSVGVEKLVSLEVGEVQAIPSIGP